MRLDPYIRKALVELESKTLNDVQVETSLTWAGRACAAAKLGLLHDALEYAHESVEHAALSGHDRLLREVRSAMRACGIEV
jgi:hypothetical protein